MIMLQILVAIVIFLFISGLNISFENGLKITLTYWWRGVGLLLILAGFYIYLGGEIYISYRKGMDKGAEIVEEVLKEKELNKNGKNN